MDIGLLAIAALVAGIVIGLVVRKRRAGVENEPRTNSGPPDRGARSTPIDVEEFHGLVLEIDKTPSPCAAAGRLSGRVLRPREAPQLPLADCDAKVCRCLFRHQSEMRQRERRKAEDRRDSLRFDPTKADRRSGDDRRSAINIWKGRS